MDQKKKVKVCDASKERRQKVRTIIRALANDSMATASFPGVLLARSVTTLAISISEQPDGEAESVRMSMCR